MLNLLAAPRKLWNPSKSKLHIPGLVNMGDVMDRVYQKHSRRDRLAGIELGPVQDFGIDPHLLGYDLKPYRTVAAVREMSQVLDYTSSGTDSVDLPTDMFITGILLSADPYRHGVTLAAITVVEDAADKVISALNITGGITFFNLSSTVAFLKALGNLNKYVYGGTLPKEDLATAVAATADSRQAWMLHFGAFNDYSFFDITSGIPGEDLNSLTMNATFGANNIIAVTAGNGTVDANTDIYALVFGVVGLPPEYRHRAPMPEYRHIHYTAPTATTTENLEPKRWLKRTTILNLAAVASNNESRNNSNLNNISVRFLTPGGGESYLFHRVRWQNFLAIASLMAGGRGPENERDGSVAAISTGLPGVAVIDWRRITGNPYGLDLTKFSSGQVSIVIEVGTTTGSLHFLHEYCALPDPSVPHAWPPYRPV